MNSLNIKNLSYSYNYFKNKKLITNSLSEEEFATIQLKNINLEVNDGLTVILGPNGAGKSTLIKLITTLNEYKKGSINFNGIEYKNNLSKVREYLGYLPQDFSTYGNITGRDFLDIIARIKEVHKTGNINEEINKIVVNLGMENYISKNVGSYSGGMRQKLGIAQLLLGNSKLIILDEPTVGLDPEQRNIIREILPNIANDRIVIVTTHIVEDVEFYCKSLIVLKDGEVLYSGDKSKFIESYRGRIWETIIRREEYCEMKSKVYILAKKESEENIKIKYIGKEKINNNSKLVEPTLEDAYIAAQQNEGQVIR